MPWETGIFRFDRSLEIEPGGRLIIEPGAFIQLWDGPNPDGAAVIKVTDLSQVKGQLFNKIYPNRISENSKSG